MADKNTKTNKTGGEKKDADLPVLRDEVLMKKPKEEKVTVTTSYVPDNRGFYYTLVKSTYGDADVRGSCQQQDQVDAMHKKVCEILAHRDKGLAWAVCENGKGGWTEYMYGGGYVSYDKPRNYLENLSPDVLF
jgi:hypothetical protein